MLFKKSFKNLSVKLYEKLLNKLKLHKVQTGAAGESKGNDDNVVDAEFEEVKEDK